MLNLYLDFFISLICKTEEKHRTLRLSQEDCGPLCSQEPSSWVPYGWEGWSVQQKGSVVGKDITWKCALPWSLKIVCGVFRICAVRAVSYLNFKWGNKFPFFPKFPFSSRLNKICFPFLSYISKGIIYSILVEALFRKSWTNPNLKFKLLKHFGNMWNQRYYIIYGILIIVAVVLTVRNVAAQ